MRKLAAYTIMEIIVVMMLSCVTIAIAYKVYDIYGRLFLTYKKSGDKITDLVLLDRLIAADVDKAEDVIWSGKGFVCRGQDSAAYYTIEDSMVIRKKILKDTFKIKVIQSSWMFGGKEQNIPGAVVDCLYLQATESGDTINFIYKKEYPADVLIRKANQ